MTPRPPGRWKVETLADRFKATRASMGRALGKIGRLYVIESAQPASPKRQARLEAWLNELGRLKQDEAATMAQLDAMELWRREARLKPARAAQDRPNKPERKKSPLIFWLWLLLLQRAMQPPKPTGPGRIEPN